MPAKQKPLPSVEESLRKIAASQAEAHASIARGEASLAQMRADMAEMTRNQKEWQAKHEAEREAERKELAEWKAAREAEREADRAEREAERKELAEWKAAREAEREADRIALAKWKAEHEAEREAERAKHEAEREADRAKHEAEREADRIALAEWKAAHDKAMDDHRKSMEEWDKKMEEIRRDWGNFSGSEGEILEDNVVHAVSEAKEICGIVLDDVKPNLRKRATGLQYDALGVNGKTAVLMEVKRTLGVDDVRNFLDKQMATVTRDYPQYTKDKQLIGAMICQNFRSDKAVAAALSAGLLLLRAEGDKRLRQIKSVKAARRKT